MGQYKPMPKMETTEPSVELKLKKGGVAKKAMGGALPSAAPAMGAAPEMAARMAAMRPRGAAMMASRAPMRPAPGMPAQAMGRKKGGEIESKSMEAKEEREIKGIKKELKSHEGKPASKAHKGLKAGGLLGGIEDNRSNPNRVTGNIEGPGYKRGGKIQRNTVAQEAKTKMVKASQRKTITSKTGSLEGRGYAKGGSVTNYENTMMHGNGKMPTKPLGTKGIKQAPAGYKSGGHVAMACKDGGGFKATKKGGCW